MMKIILRIFIVNIDTPFEIESSKFMFDYGIGKEKWGSKLLTMQYALKIFGPTEIPKFKQYLEDLSAFIHTKEDIREIQLEYINDNDPDSNELIVFKANEFSNFNAQYVIDVNPRVMFAFNKII